VGSRRDRRVGSALVLAQFAMIGLSLVPVGPVLPIGPLRVMGMAFLVTGLALGGAALLGLGSDTRVHPLPAPGGELRTAGIYAHVRHPMYLAVLLTCLGVALGSARVLASVALAGLVVVLVAKSRFEDGLLRRRFGAAFDAYAARVPALVPRWRPGR
jgi:protein-S-isoprenylcysteine O-methyltransferase Ste14